MAFMKKKKTWLSHTGLELMKRCPRCFWLRYKYKLYQPQGIVSRLANRFDMVMKNYFDQYRNTDQLPPIINKNIKGRLQNPFNEKYFVHINDSYGIYGLLDECIINEENQYVPVDFKTSSSDPRNKPILDAYQSQINNYLYLMKSNHIKIADYGYLIFIYPDIAEKLKNGFPIITHIVKVNGNPDKAKEFINQAIDLLENNIPPSNPDCEYCNYISSINQLTNQ